MNRLTNNICNDYQVIDEKGDFILGENCVFKNCINKLGKLEDIEDELGCDLITLFKALKQGYIYVKLEDEIIKRDIDMLDFEDGIRGVCFAKSCDVQCYQIIKYIHDYGKTWALSEEELL